MLATLALMTVVGGSDGWAVSERAVPPQLKAMTHQEQAASSKQEFPLTPEAVAASIDLLSKTRHPVSAQTLTPKLPREVGKELVRLSQAPEETFRKLNDHLFPPMDDYAGSKLIYCRLIFLLRYRLPPKPGGYTRDDFRTYHEHLVIPPLGDLEEYKDYPTLENWGELTISPRDLYDWPWKLTEDGWQLRWFTYRTGGGMQDYEDMYNQFSKLPLRKGVNDKKALRGNPGLVYALRRQRAEVHPRARARVGLLEVWGE